MFVFVQAVVAKPAVIGFRADQSWQDFADGIYTGSAASPTFRGSRGCIDSEAGHAVLVTGYDMSSDPFWIIKVRRALRLAVGCWWLLIRVACLRASVQPHPHPTPTPSVNLQQNSWGVEDFKAKGPYPGYFRMAMDADGPGVCGM